jgi:NADPH-dependent glutamate synthase beta subunit-like oxidoreductase
MPASEEEVDGGEIEGVRSRFQRAPVRILGTDHVEGLVVPATERGPPDASGRRSMTLVLGSEETIPCDTGIVAAGEKADTERLEEPDFKISSHGWPEGKHADAMTGVEGVFASGGKSVVHAMAAGFRAADDLDAFVAKKLGRAPMPRPDPRGGPRPPSRPEGYDGVRPGNSTQVRS